MFSDPESVVKVVHSGDATKMVVPDLRDEVAEPNNGDVPQ
jgi:hypothetical protein